MPRAANRTARKSSRKPSRRPSRKKPSSQLSQLYNRHVKNGQSLATTAMAALAIALSGYTLAKVETAQTSQNAPVHAWPAYNAVATGVTATYDLNGDGYADLAVVHAKPSAGIGGQANASGQATDTRPNYASGATPTWTPEAAAEALTIMPIGIGRASNAFSLQGVTSGQANPAKLKEQTAKTNSKVSGGYKQSAVPSFLVLGGGWNVDRQAKANGQVKGAKLDQSQSPATGTSTPMTFSPTETIIGVSTYGLSVTSYGLSKGGAPKVFAVNPIEMGRGSNIFGLVSRALPYRTPVGFQLAPNSASNGLSPTLGLGPAVAYIYPMAYAPYGYRPHVMAYAPYGYRAAARPGAAMQSGMGAPHAAAAVTCDINDVRAATSSVRDCEKAGGSVIAANAAAQAVQSRN